MFVDGTPNPLPAAAVEDSLFGEAFGDAALFGDATLFGEAFGDPGPAQHVLAVECVVLVQPDLAHVRPNMYWQ